MRFNRRNNQTSKINKLFRIVGSLAISGGLFCCVFLGIFDFKLSIAEMIIAAGLSSYGLGEILFGFLSKHNKRTSGGRIFLSVFFSMLLLYSLSLMLLILSDKAGERGNGENLIVNVETPSYQMNDDGASSDNEAITEEKDTEDSNPEYIEEVKLPVPSAPVFTSAFAMIPEMQSSSEYDSFSSDGDYEAENDALDTDIQLLEESGAVPDEDSADYTVYEENIADTPENVISAPVFISVEESLEETADDIRIPDVPLFMPVQYSVSDDAVNEYVPGIPSITASSYIAELPASVPSAPSVMNYADLLYDAESAYLIHGAFRSEEDPETIEGEWADTASDDDFWADFYIAGEDDFVLEDGSYYFDLYINGSLRGEVEVVFENGDIRLLSDDLRGYVDGYITEDADKRIFRGEEYLTAEELENRGLSVDVFTDDYKVMVVFSPDDMPIEMISISGGRYSRSSKNIAGAAVLDPAVFTLLTRYNLSTSFSILPTSSFADSIAVDLNTSNTFRLYDVNGSFLMNLRYYDKNVSFRLNNLNFYYTIPEKMLRLSWGNVSPDLLYASGENIGFRIDKSITYAPEGTKRPSHIEKIISIEKDSDVQILNEGKEIFRRTLSAGKYSLNDFILYSGANRIRIIINPLDGSASEEYELDVNYSSALLAPGEFYYGAAVSTGANKVASNSSKASTAVRMPWFGNYSYEFDARNFALSFYMRAGLTKTLTMNSTFALSNVLSDVSWFMPKLRGSFELTHANRFGAARYNLNVGSSRNSRNTFTLPSAYFKLSQQFATKWKPLSSVSLSGSYTLAEQSEFKDWGTAAAQIGFGGSVGFVSWNMSGNANVPLKNPETFTWSVSSSLSAYVSKNVSLSASGSFYSSADSRIGFSGRVAASISFSPVKAEVAYSNSGLSASLNASDARNAFSLSMNSAKPESFDSYSFSADYSYSGNYVGFAARTSTSSGFKNMRGSVSLSASSVFADGVFAFSQSIPSNFVLIKQKGILKGNELTVGAIGTSSPAKINKSFGIGLYKGIPSGGNASFTVFSTNSSSFGTAASFDFYAPKSNRSGYVATLTAVSTYSAAGYVFDSAGNTWSNGSSPLYAVSVGDDGSLELELSDEYLFTDSDGLFIASGISSGIWAFDAEIDGVWYLYVFTVSDNPSHAIDIMMLGNPSPSSSYKAGYPYSAVYGFSSGSYLSGDQFWDMLYGEREDV